MVHDTHAQRRRVRARTSTITLDVCVAVGLGSPDVTHEDMNDCLDSTSSRATRRPGTKPPHRPGRHRRRARSRGAAAPLLRPRWRTWVRRRDTPGSRAPLSPWRPGRRSCHPRRRPGTRRTAHPPTRARRRRTPRQNCGPRGRGAECSPSLLRPRRASSTLALPVVRGVPSHPPTRRCRRRRRRPRTVPGDTIPIPIPVPVPVPIPVPVPELPRAVAGRARGRRRARPRARPGGEEHPGAR